MDAFNDEGWIRSRCYHGISLPLPSSIVDRPFSLSSSLALPLLPKFMIHRIGSLLQPTTPQSFAFSLHFYYRIAEKGGRIDNFSLFSLSLHGVRDIGDNILDNIIQILDNLCVIATVWRGSQRVGHRPCPRKPRIIETNSINNIPGPMQLLTHHRLVDEV